MRITVAMHETDNETAHTSSRERNNPDYQGKPSLMLAFRNTPESSISRGVLRIFTNYGSTSPAYPLMMTAPIPEQMLGLFNALHGKWEKKWVLRQGTNEAEPVSSSNVI